ncbi:flagellar basal body-associated FliL family protein [Roseobacter sinensis]|uniref:Flagellar protein FliL n=1 Tax=Roseobacter sinensis TaxID=2931391 RepID=A0ABT3B8H8_9RHOB|nr:flagellar basal body-associated FliL family protein [Roseobacter sp. WL0113]MCV3269882.1 flagellar basal body-associated FliL family protein [Roseobacter sp. WL0113]
MADAAIVEDESEPKSSKMPLIIGLVLLLLGGGGGFYATWSGLLFGAESEEPKAEETKTVEGPAVAFVPIDPITVSLPPGSPQSHLRFRAELEVASKYASDVEAVLPRVVDVLNGYLRAIDAQDIANPSALTRLRAQMLRRVQVVTGPEQVKDLLIMEFVLN